MPTPDVPARPTLRRLKSRARALHHAIRAKEPGAVAAYRKYHPQPIDPVGARLSDAQLVLARSYGFPSWPRLTLACSLEERPRASARIKPHELDERDDQETWETITAARDGDVATLTRLLSANPKLSRAQFWYTPAIHFAVREGHADAVQILLDAGADPEWNGLHQGSMIEMARDRGHGAIADALERARDRRGRTRAASADHAIHAAVAREDMNEVPSQLDRDPRLVELGNSRGAAPLHIAVCNDALEMVTLLLDRGANVNAFRGSSRGLSGGFWTDLQPIDDAIWGGKRNRSGAGITRLLLERGAAYDLTIAAALGDLDGVRQMLDTEPTRVQETRPSGRRPLSAAIESGHDAIAALLIERGADPNWEEPTAPRGRALHAAARAGKLELVRLLLAHGADPNGEVDSSGNALSAASTPEVRALVAAHGGTADPYDYGWLDDDERLEAVVADPRAAYRIGAAFTMVVGDKREDLLMRLLQAGFRVPSVFTGCQTYLLADTNLLRVLLEHGMSPDQMNWQHQTLLHHTCNGPNSTGGAIERAALLLDAGADISARDDEYRSTPLAWAARTNAVEMVEFLLGRGARAQLPDDEPWATPLAWAERRQHTEVASILRRRGAER